jgi:hypothetical protein
MVKFSAASNPVLGSVETSGSSSLSRVKRVGLAAMWPNPLLIGMRQ